MPKGQPASGHQRLSPASVTYTLPSGESVAMAYQAKGSPVNFAARREEFCRLMSTGDTDPTTAYAIAYRKPLEGATEDQKKLLYHMAHRLLQDPDVRLRIDQLKTPVVRKYAKQFEYTIQRAFAQCDEAYNLARIEGDSRAMLKAVELQGKFAKLLSEQLEVNHRIGLLDDASTDTLLKMLAMLEKKRHGGRGEVGGSEGAANCTIDVTPQAPALVPSAGPIRGQYS